MFLPAQLQQELLTEIHAQGLGDVAEDIVGDTSNFIDMKANVRKLDQQVGPLPLSLRIWYEEVGAVNLYGYHPEWLKYVRFPTHLMNYCDPLQVCVLGDTLVDHLLDLHQHTPMKHFEFAPDRHFKDNRAGSSTPYDISWQESVVDGVLLRNQTPNLTFVGYLRNCFHWAGFPGMATWPEVPADDLAILKEGLIPF